MDWRGQKLAEDLTQYLLVVIGSIAFLTGYFRASFELMALIFAGGVLITMLLTIPNWPPYNRQGLKWLTPEVAAASATPIKTTAKPVSGASKRGTKATRK